MKLPMELRDLKLFLDVAATGSFSRAATLTASTQSAVSKRIAALEAALGTPLFLRNGRGAALTDAGRTLLPRAEALTAEAKGLADALSDARTAPRGEVRMVVQPSIGWPLVGDLIDAARARYPGIRFQISEGTARQIEEWLADGRVDLGIMSSLPPAAYAEAEELFSLSLLLLSKAGAPATRGRTVAFERLRGLPLVTATAPNGARVQLEEEARRRDIPLTFVLDINSVHIIKKLVARGEYMTVITAPAVAVEVAAGELATARIVRPELRQTFYLVVGGRRHPGAAVRAVADLVRELTATLTAHWR